MGTLVPPIMPIFRSQVQGELLAAVLLTSGAEFSLTELAQRIGAALSTVHREVTRLEAAGVLTSRRVGNVRFVRANPNSPAYAPLRDLVERYFGVPVVIAEEFGELDGIDELYVFGSWAARASGLAGPDPNDIDVLVIGQPDRDATYESALRVERRVGKPVNVTIRTPEAWARKADGFLQHVATSNLIPIISTSEDGGVSE
ncbi:MAG TPA: nucleotidyltransferase domain-containing protein [Jiangellaceae bacterium]